MVAETRGAEAGLAQTSATQPLAGYRVLDLTDHRGELGPWMLAELGADVVKIEPPQGTPARQALPASQGQDSQGPVQSGPGQPAPSWQFCAYNSNKRSIALDLAAPDLAALDSATPDLAVPGSQDSATFEALVRSADFIFSSEPDGFLSQAGYDFKALASLNARIVHVQITPFGADGPRSSNAYSELTLAALGGAANLQGVPDRAPVKSSVPQVWRHAGVEAANAGLIAHARMCRDGQAQQVVVSAQAAVTWTLLNAMEAHAISGEDFHRTGSVVMLAAPLQLRHKSADGHVIAIARGAVINNIVEWLIDEAIVPADWRQEDWETFDLRALSGETVDHSFQELFDAVAELCARYDKDTLMRKALKYRQTIAPINTVADLLEFDHLEKRDFWTTAAAGRGMDDVKLPGSPVTINGERLTGTGKHRASDSEHRAGTGERRPPFLDEDGDQIRAGLANNSSSPDDAAPDETSPDASPDTSPNEPAPNEPALPMAGIKVADFSWIGVGPITTKSLADHGATVVRIECAARPDGLRVNPPFKDKVVDPDMSHFFGTFNTSKLSIDVDLGVPEGLEIAKKMIAWADVVIESWRPGSFAAAGLSDDTITALNPNVILVHTSLLASGGPLSGLAGYGYHAAAIAGFYPIVGWPDLPPDGPYLAYTDTISPRFITATLLSALDRRRRTGQGCIIEAAQLECGLQFLAPELLDYQLSGHIAKRNGNRDGDVAPQGVYPCAGDDRWCAITIATDKQWQDFAVLLGQFDWAKADWAKDPQLATLAGRMAAHDEIDKRLAAITADFGPFELEQKLTEVGIAAGVVQRSSDLLADPQYQHQGFYRYLDHQRMGNVPYAGHQYQIAGYDSGPYDSGPLWAAPTLGQHTFEVLSDLLGLDTEQIAELAATGALG